MRKTLMVETKKPSASIVTAVPHRSSRIAAPTPGAVPRTFVASVDGSAPRKAVAIAARTRNVAVGRAFGDGARSILRQRRDVLGDAPPARLGEEMPNGFLPPLSS